MEQTLQQPAEKSPTMWRAGGGEGREGKRKRAGGCVFGGGGKAGTADPRNVQIMTCVEWQPSKGFVESNLIKSI